MAWDPPKQGTKAREKMNSTAFLDQKNKRYPWKKNGKPSKQGLMAAYKRARQQGDSAIAAKAARLLKSHFGYTVGGNKK